MTAAECSVYSGSLILVNAAHPYHAAQEPDLVRLDSGVLLARQASRVLLQTLSRINGQGRIVPVSGWRSNAEQTALYMQSLRENGTEFTEKYVAPPGCSEHQTGLAIDLALKKDAIDLIRPDFPYNGICQAFRKIAVRFGFIERYPKGKEAITGIAHEPWHFRYVGAPHAEIMQERGLCLEEYLEFLKSGPCCFRSGHARIRVSYFDDTRPLPAIEDGIPYTVSGDNVGGRILTEWREL